MSNVKNNLREKIYKVIDIHNKIKEENEDLKKKNVILEKELQEMEENLSEISTKYSSLKIAQNLELSENDKGESLKKVNEIVRDVNKCIALLNT